MERTPRIVVVDDEPELCLLIAEYLGRNGLDVRTAGGGAGLDALLAEGPADMPILDVTMPGEDGLSIVRRVRAGGGDTPILMLTSLGDRVVALELGVDDYVTKPFDLRELRARVRTILRRANPAPATEPGSGPTAATPGGRVRFGRLVLDTEARRLFDGDGGAEVPLTAMELDLVLAFAANPNRVLSRDRLLDLAHRGERDDPFDRSVDIRVARLRRKVEADPAKPVVIRTVRGTGYMFVPDGDAHRLQ